MESQPRLRLQGNPPLPVTSWEGRKNEPSFTLEASLRIAQVRVGPFLAHPVFKKDALHHVEMN